MSDPDPTAGWQAVQCEGLRLTRVRGVPLAGEAEYRRGASSKTQASQERGSGGNFGGNS